jgi:hypothetical protein
VTRALLLSRLLAETLIGLICMSTVLLLPRIWKGAFPERFILSYLGMPRPYQGPPPFVSFTVAVTLASLLGLTSILLIGTVCIKDVPKVIRKLRAD